MQAIEAMLKQVLGALHVSVSVQDAGSFTSNGPSATRKSRSTNGFGSHSELRSDGGSQNGGVDCEEHDPFPASSNGDHDSNADTDEQSHGATRDKDDGDQHSAGDGMPDFAGLYDNDDDDEARHPTDSVSRPASSAGAAGSEGYPDHGGDDDEGRSAGRYGSDAGSDGGMGLGFFDNDGDNGDSDDDAGRGSDDGGSGAGSDGNDDDYDEDY